MLDRDRPPLNPRSVLLNMCYSGTKATQNARKCHRQLPIILQESKEFFMGQILKQVLSFLVDAGGKQPECLSLKD